MTLEEMVQRFKSGDLSVRNSLVFELMPVALTIASRVSRKNPRRADDVTSVALYNLIVSVDAFPVVSTDDNITAYVAKRIRCETLSCLSEHTVLSKRTLYRKLQKGESIPSLFEVLEADALTDGGFEAVDQRDLVSTIYSFEERQVLNLRLKGYTNEEIAKIVGMSESYIQRLTQRIRHVFEHWSNAQR